MKDMKVFFMLFMVLVVGSAVTVANRHLPLVRNSLVYASATDHVIAHGYDPRPVVADSKLSYDKPILYSWMSAPFVARLGSHDGRGVFFTSARGTWIQVGIAFLLQLQVALVFGFRRKPWTRDLAPMLVCFGLIYVLALMPFPTTFYNMRYFVPLFPLLAIVLVKGAAASTPPVRRGVWIGHACVGATLILIFNVVQIYRAASPIIPTLEVNWIGTPLSLLDNLRMAQHLEQAAVLDRINAAVPPHGTIYMLDVNYYGDAERNVFERAGLIRSDISSRYVSRSTFQPDTGTSFIWAFSKRPPAAPPGSTVTNLGDSIYRLDR
jgi:hypothetical protein